MMSDTLIDWICQALATFLLHEGQEGLFKHGWCAEDDHGKAVILVWQAQTGRQHGVIPANLRRCKVLMKNDSQCQEEEFLRGISKGYHAEGKMPILEALVFTTWGKQNYTNAWIYNI